MRDVEMCMLTAMAMAMLLNEPTMIEKRVRTHTNTMRNQNIFKTVYGCVSKLATTEKCGR